MCGKHGNAYIFKTKAWASFFLAFLLPLPPPLRDRTLKHLKEKPIKIKAGIIFQVEVQNSLLFAGLPYFLKSDGAFQDFSMLSHKPATHSLFYLRPPGRQLSSPWQSEHKEQVQGTFRKDFGEASRSRTKRMLFASFS